jgi:hypothetical protein
VKNVEKGKIIERKWERKRERKRKNEEDKGNGQVK